VVTLPPVRHAGAVSGEKQFQQTSLASLVGSTVQSAMRCSPHILTPMKDTLRDSGMTWMLEDNLVGRALFELAASQRMAYTPLEDFNTITPRTKLNARKRQDFQPTYQIS